MKHSPQINRIVMIVVAIGFLALLIFGPLLEATLTEQLFSVALVAASVVVVIFATRRPAFALALPTILFGAILIASALKFHYLTAPLLAPDLVYFLNRDLLDVATRYPLIMFALVAGAILIPGLLYLVWRFDRPHFLGHVAPPHRHWLLGAGTLTAAVLVLVIDSPPGPFSDVFEKGMWQTMNDKSYVTDFFTSFYQTEIKIPPIAAGAAPLTWSQPDTDNPPACTPGRCVGATTRSTQTHPDIVSVLEESTFDPAMLEVCKLPLCKHKMFAPDGRTRAHGFLTIHVWGGGTWTSEFALLTGLDHQLFGDAGLYAPYNLAPRVVHTLPRVLQGAGYRTIAIYPMSGDFINARNAYKFYGFDRFYDGQDYGLSWDSSDNDLMQVFDRIYADEKKAVGDQPLFIMLLTLRQHGPHSTPLKELPAPYDKPLFPGPRRVDEPESRQLPAAPRRLRCRDDAPGKDPARRRAADAAVPFRRSSALVRRRDARTAQSRAEGRERSEFRHLLHAQDQLQSGAQLRLPGLRPELRRQPDTGHCRHKEGRFLPGERADARALPRLLHELRQQASARRVPELHLP
jgi:phosphoglycerol transferase MdoB-like AlkP superfamily enzyme